MIPRIIPTCFSRWFDSKSSARRRGCRKLLATDSPWKSEVRERTSGKGNNFYYFSSLSQGISVLNRRLLEHRLRQCTYIGLRHRLAKGRKALRALSRTRSVHGGVIMSKVHMSCSQTRPGPIDIMKWKHYMSFTLHNRSTLHDKSTLRRLSLGV